MGISYNSSIVRDGLVLQLDATNIKSYPGTGAVWKDLSGNKNDGSLINGITYDSNDGGSLLFDGVNDYASFPNSNSLNVTGDNITLEVTYKNNDLADVSHGDGLISKGSGGNDGQYEILLIPVNGKNKAFFRINSMGLYSPGTILMDVGKIYNICCVLNNKFMTIYVNGIQDGPGELKTGSIISRATPLAIGSRQLQTGTSSSAVNGYIYSSKIYNRALSTQEIQQNFEAIRGRYGV